MLDRRGGAFDHLPSLLFLVFFCSCFCFFFTFWSLTLWLHRSTYSIPAPGFVAFVLTILVADCSTCSTFYSHWSSNNLFLCLHVLPPLLYAFIFRICQQLIVSFCLMCMLPINDHITPLVIHSLTPSHQAPPQVITLPHQSPPHCASTTTSSLCIIRVNHHFIALRHHLITAPITH